MSHVTSLNADSLHREGDTQYGWTWQEDCNGYVCECAYNRRRESPHDTSKSCFSGSDNAQNDVLTSAYTSARVHAKPATANVYDRQRRSHSHVKIGKKRTRRREDDKSVLQQIITGSFLLSEKTTAQQHIVNNNNNTTRCHENVTD